MTRIAGPLKAWLTFQWSEAFFHKAPLLTVLKRVLFAEVSSLDQFMQRSNRIQNSDLLVFKVRNFVARFQFTEKDVSQADSEQAFRTLVLLSRSCRLNLEVQIPDSRWNCADCRWISSCRHFWQRLCSWCPGHFWPAPFRTNSSRSLEIGRKETRINSRKFFG